MGVGVVVGVWVARYLGPERFGLLSFAIAFVGIFSAFAGLGLKDIVVRDIVRDPECKEEILSTAALLQLLGGLLAYGIVLAAVFWLRPDDALARVLVAILGTTTLFGAAQVVAYWFESQVLSKYTVWVGNATFLVFAAIKVALILNNAPLVEFAWAAAAEAMLAAVLLIVMFRVRGPKLHQLSASYTRAKALLKDSWPLLMSGMAIMIYLKIDQIMLGQMVSDESVGIYSAATRISEIWYFIPMAIAASVFPSLLETKKRSETQYYRRLQHLFDLMVWMAIAIAVPMTFLSSPLVVLIFGEAFADSGIVLAIHIWAAVFVFLGVASGKWFLAENRQMLNMQRSALGAIANVILNLWLIPDYGAVGAALATVISYAIAAFFADLLQKDTRTMFLMKVSALNPLGVFGRYL